MADDVCISGIKFLRKRLMKEREKLWVALVWPVGEMLKAGPCSEPEQMLVCVLCLLSSRSVILSFASSSCLQKPCSASLIRTTGVIRCQEGRFLSVCLQFILVIVNSNALTGTYFTSEKKKNFLRRVVS